MAAQALCFDNICRICAEEGSEQFIPIFEHPGLELSLLTKIEDHLPIKVLLSDNLPHQVCEACICKLNICHNLVETAKAADLKLRHLLSDSSNEVLIGVKLEMNKDDHLQCNEIGVIPFQLDSDNLSTAKTFQLPGENVVTEKTLQDVQFEIAITDSIEVVKSIDVGQQLHVTTDSSSTVNTDGIFQVSHTNVLNDDQFSLTSVYQSQITEENSKNISDVVIDEHITSKPLSDENQNKLRPKEYGGKTEEINDKFSCPQCGKVCKSVVGLEVHISTHSEVTPFLCDLCGKNFKHLNSLYCHKRTHLDESQKKRHQCAICNKAFRSKFHLNEHMNIHNGIKPHKCLECGKTFHKKIQVRQHARTHLPEQDKLVCSVCCSKFTRKSNLLVHIKTCHAENRTYKCRVCSDQFTTLNQLLSHRRSHKQDNIIEQNLSSEHSFPCHICGKVLSKKKSLELHLQSHSGENKCWCNVCGKELSSKASLRYHFKAFHSTERRWHCQYCGKGYMSHELQLIHERTHTGIKPYKCSVCGAAFRSGNSLNQHMQKHSTSKNFQCMYCPKQFQRKSTLTIHTRTHTGEKPYACDTCGYRFVQKNDMVKHRKTHRLLESVSKSGKSDQVAGIMEKDFGCDSCNSIFNSDSELNKHKLMEHGITIPVIFNSQNNDMLTSITEIITEDGQNILLSNVSTC